MSANPKTAACTRLQFDGVVLDLARRTVWVDDRPVGCSAKAFALLQVLAERPRQPLTRDRLITLIWPGGQQVSDEALTQLVFRARAVLGRYGDLLQTVRGVGFELISDVRLLDAPAVSGESSPPPVSADPMPAPLGSPAEPGSTHAASIKPRPERRALAMSEPAFRTLLATLVISLLGVLVWRWQAPPPVVADAPLMLNSGYGLSHEDLPGASGQTLRLVEQALLREELGERQRAVSLLEAAHSLNPEFGLPATFLALAHFGSGQIDTARDWLTRARQRLSDSPIAYEHLLYDYVAAEMSGDVDRVIAKAGALLDLRPDAWRLRHARAHMYEYRGQREAALEELRQIDIPALGLRKRDMVIADLAFFGDPDFALKHLQRLAADPDQASWHLLYARLAWSGNDWATAADHSRQAFDLAERVGAQDLRNRSAIQLGAAQLLLHDDEAALVTLERARSLVAGSQPRDELDLSVILAMLRHQRGEQAAFATDLQRARELLAVASTGDGAEGARLALLRLSPEHPPPAPEAAATSARMAMWEAALAFYKHNDQQTARRQLALAIDRGIERTRLWDEARLLQKQLGLNPGPAHQRIPLFPPLSRLLSYRQLAAPDPG